ncbi:MAG: insulinase family protein [Polyangiaceae bacterium]|nr:insulinase family protein [Polyangiaceae bacterium]
MTDTPLAAESTAAPLPSAPTVLVEFSDAVPLATVSVALRSGATEDPDGLEGLTRLSGRLARRTAGGRAPREIDAAIDALGGALGVDTSHSTSALHGTVISRNLDSFIDTVVDVLGRPSLDEAELARLVRETEAARVEALDNDRGVARHWFRRRMFAEHPYGRSVVGTSRSLAQMTRTHVQHHLARTWVRGNLLLACSGDISEDKAREIGERIAQAVPLGPATEARVPEPVGPVGRTLLFVDKPERTQTQILIGCLGTHPQDDDHMALYVANTVFGGTFTARLTREVRSKRGWSYGAYSSLPIDKQRRAFSMWTFPKASDAAACLSLELKLLEELVERGVTAKELAWVKRFLVRSHAFAIDTASKRVGLALDSVLYDLPPRYYDSYIERVNAVTLEQANGALRRRLTPDHLLITVLGTERDIGGAVREAIPHLATAESVPFDRED